MPAPVALKATQKRALEVVTHVVDSQWQLLSVGVTKPVLRVLVRSDDGFSSERFRVLNVFQLNGY